MSPRLRARIWLLSGFPRVSGDEPTSCANSIGVDTFSPRERG